MDWELRRVEDTDAVIDDSGVYVVVHRVETPETHKEYSGIRVTVRADLMRVDSEPIKGPEEEAAACIMSFQGTANAVRKALARFWSNDNMYRPISMEHASYIGYELLRAELTPNYQQD